MGIRERPLLLHLLILEVDVDAARISRIATGHISRAWLRNETFSVLDAI